jgi:uncharacterized protein (TIGR02284 family)
MNADTKQNDIDTLNSLLSLTIDSAKGYREAADLTKNSTLSAMFIARADERDQIAEEFQEEVSRFGGKPHEHGTAAGAAHRLALDIRAMVDSNTTTAINEVERGEDVIKAAYEKALARTDICDKVRTLVNDAYTSSIKTGHDQASALKHAAA